MINFRKHSTYVLLNIFLVPIFFMSLNEKYGGFQLLMSLEQQKKTQRVISYLQEDIGNLNRELRGILYKGKNPRRDVVINADTKDQVVLMAKKVGSNFDELDGCFRSIYFDYADDRTKKEFDSIKEFRQTLTFSSSDIDKALLSQLYQESSESMRKLDMLGVLVKTARIEEEAKIKERMSAMTIWQWLFGY